jgi:hypothetical protein
VWISQFDALMRTGDFLSATILIEADERSWFLSQRYRRSASARRRCLRRFSVIDFRQPSFAFFAPFIAASLVAGTVCAQTAPAPKSAKNAAASVVVVITNSRTVTLTELDATPTAGYLPKAIARNVAPGKKASATVATDKDCTFNLHGIYSDGTNSDLTSVDLCKDRNVNLID